MKKEIINKKFYILFYVIIALVIITFISASYAYYQSKVIGNPTPQEGTAAKLQINFENENIISVVNAYPIYEEGYKENADKLTFTLTGEGSTTSSCYQLELEVEAISTGLISEDFRWILYDTNQNKAVSGGDFSGASVGDSIVLLDKQLLTAETEINYELYVFIRNNPDTNQISMMNSTFEGHIKGIASTEVCTNGTTAISFMLSPTLGTLYAGGTSKNVTVTGINYGNVTCSSNNNSIATCEANGNDIEITPVGVGTGRITVREGNGNTAVYVATVLSKPVITLNNQSATTGGTASVAAEPGYAMPTITVPTKTGYTFGGYYTAANGSGTQYYNANGTSTRNSTFTSDTTLYAKWNTVTYTLTYDNNGGSGCTTKPVIYKNSYGTLCTPQKTGYNFTGWYNQETSNNGSGTQITSPTTVNTAGNHTVYAQWSLKSTVVTFDHQGATSGGYPQTTINYGTMILHFSSMLNPQKVGYTFDGYYTGTNGSGTQIFNTSGSLISTWTIESPTITLYAKWNKIYTCTLGALSGITNGGIGTGETLDAACANACYNALNSYYTSPTVIYGTKCYSNNSKCTCSVSIPGIDGTAFPYYCADSCS